MINTHSKNSAPLVSIIIPHFNDLTNLSLCLELLSVQTLSDRSFEVIVADNNSSCGLEAVVQTCKSRAQVISVSLQGAAYARNKGVEVSRGQILAFIDSDCRPSNTWLENGVAALKSFDMAGGRVDIGVADESRLTGVEAFERVFAFDFKRYIEAEKFSGSGNMFVPRQIFHQVGDFRAGVSEDKDWGQRAASMGFQWVYAPDAVVVHPARRNWGDLRSKWKRIMRESYALHRSKHLSGTLWLLKAWATLFSPLIHAVRIFRSHKLERNADKIKAILILFRIRAWRFIEAHKLIAPDVIKRRRI